MPTNLITWCYVCYQDKHVFRVHRGGPDARLLTAITPCPTCRNDISIEDEFPGEYLVTTHSPKEFYIASMGHGFPSERDASVESVSFWLLGGTITDVVIDPAPVPERCLLTQLTVDKGGRKATISIGTSVHGPTVFKLSLGDP